MKFSWVRTLTLTVSQRERADSVRSVGLPRHKLKILKAPVVIVRRPLHAEDALHDLKFGVETRFRKLEFIGSNTCLIKIDLGQRGQLLSEARDHTHQIVVAAQRHLAVFEDLYFKSVQHLRGRQ